MKASHNRRDFLKHCSQLGMSCAFLLCGKNIMAAKASIVASQEKKKDLDPDKFTYCGYQCKQCELLKATLNNDEELKKKVYKTWKWKEQYGIEYDPDKVFCYGCKADDKPSNPVLDKCQVRKCAREKELAACFQCEELKSCDKEYWAKYPQQKTYTLKLQEKYKESIKKD